jgi:hypothetical protein
VKNLIISARVDSLIDYIWVQDLTALMHLGLINGPFVPHIKIKGACSPAKLQMAPRLVFLMSSGSKKRGTKIHM